MAHPERNLGDEQIESSPDEKDAFNGRDELFEQDGTKGTKIPVKAGEAMHPQLFPLLSKVQHVSKLIN